jgi:hypothetical protein
MDSSIDTLISIDIPTRHGINIYSSIKISQYEFYKQTLRGEELTIVLNYEKTAETEGDEEKTAETEGDEEKTREDEDDNSDTFLVDDLLDAISVFPDKHTLLFSELFGNEFNSSQKYRIFDMINESYHSKYGYDVLQSPVFKKYNELIRKTNIIERQTAEIYKTLNIKSKKKISELSLGDKIKKCHVLLLEPYKNDKEIVNLLEDVMGEYKSCLIEEKEEKQKEEIRMKKIEDDELKNDLIIRRNTFGQFIYVKYNLVFDPKEKCIIGVSNKMGGSYPLDLGGVQLCEKLMLKYKIVNEQRF